MEFPEPAPAIPVDQAQLLDAVDGDWELLRDLTDSVAATHPAILSELQAAVSNHDVMAVAQHAHRLKGSFGNLYALRAAEIAAKLETSAMSGDLTGARELVDLLAVEAARALNYLSQLEPA